MNYTEFALKYNGKFLDYDGVYGAQCVDVIKQYFVDVLGLTPISGNAVDYWKDIPGFTRIPKTMFSWPKPGDIIVWDKAVSQYGHIGICNWVRTFDFNCFEQNFPTGSPCHYQTHASYRGVLGWLRPDPLPNVKPITYHVLYLSDRDDFAVPLKLASDKLRSLSGGLVGLSYEFKRITRVVAPDKIALPTDTASQIIEAEAAENPEILTASHGIVLGYVGNQDQRWYLTQESINRGILYSCGQRPWPSDLVAFEMKHQITRFYNKFRGSRPYIDVVDNYSGGDEIIRNELRQVLPYLDVFREHEWYN